MLEILLVIMILSALIIFIWMSLLIRNYALDSEVYGYFHSIGMSKREQKNNFIEYRKVINEFYSLYNKYYNYQTVSCNRFLFCPTTINEELTPVNDSNFKDKISMYSQFPKPIKVRITECYKKYYLLSSSIRYYENLLKQGRNTQELISKNNEKFQHKIPLLVNEKMEYLSLINKEVERIIDGLKEYQAKLEDCINKLGRMDRGDDHNMNNTSFVVLDQVIYTKENCQVTKKNSFSFTGVSVVQKSLENIKLLESKELNEKSSRSSVIAASN
ncbi:hypothetical protein [Mangrovibacillus cuniculi]|uniref:Uncharacterized protein n=1 Tax=Mangrovibacillus cuniculi TaxID=2593652 RepID=A0A7S8CCQ9_9BACI|nr:hypothetical protein [Mangrovibacillus cuniculi]QPC47580.1 hypothetical protein G8O30_11765 [Mangrovibacillus cuniculi]